MIKLAPNDVFTLLLPSSEKGRDWTLPGNCQIQYILRPRIHELRRIWDIYWGLERICRSQKVDICLTLGDIGPIDLGVPHVIYLHRAYLIYPESYLIRALSWYERMKLRYLSRHFGLSAKRAAAVIVQTPISADRLARLYPIDRTKVYVISPALTAHVRALRNTEPTNYSKMLLKSSAQRLLFPATYYVHKNHMILPSLISELRQRGLAKKVHFFLTLNGHRHPAEAMLLKRLESESNTVTNLGELEPGEIGAALITADALFFPTLVETFGLVYLEALALAKPILTSDRDFAHYICGELALYFDPLDPVSIADTIGRYLEELSTRNQMLREKAPERLSQFPQSEEENAAAFLSILHQAKASQTS